MQFEEERRTTRPMEYYTDRGLEKTYVSMFQKAGWMTLALTRRSDLNKVENYLERLELLADEIENRISIIKDEDKRRNYRIMLQNLLDLDKVFVEMLGSKDDKKVYVKGSQYMHATSHYDKKDHEKKRLDELSRKKNSNPYYKKW